MTQYLRQGDARIPHADCKLYALANAVRLYGGTTPEPSSPEWEHLVELCGGLHGSIINLKHAAEAWGMVLGAEQHFDEVSEVVPHLPVILSVRNPEPAFGGMHSVLVVGGSGDRLRMINWMWQTGAVDEIDIPPVEWWRINRRFKTVRPKPDKQKGASP